MMRVGIASDHGGFALKEQVADKLRGAGYEVEDFGRISYRSPEMTTRISSSLWPKPSPPRTLNADLRGVAAVWVRLLPRTKSPGCVPGSSMMFSPLIRVSKMTI